MDELVQRLSTGTHKLRPDRAKTPEEFRTSLNEGFVLLRFTETRGGTTLGVRINRDRSDFGQPDSTQNVRLVGSLVLNYNEVELTADIDPMTLEGTGSLTLIADEATWRARRAASESARETTAA